jgi:hypothetical protein
MFFFSFRLPGRSLKLLPRFAQGAVDVLVSTAVGIDRERCVRAGHDGVA